MVHSVAFSSDGKILASGGEDKKINLWNVANGKKINSFKCYEFEINAISFSPDGKTLVSNGMDNRPTIKLWDVNTGRLIRSFPSLDFNSENVSFSPDGMRVMAIDAGYFRMWEVTSGKEILSLPKLGSTVQNIVFSLNSGTVAFTSLLKIDSGKYVEKLNVLDTATGKVMSTFSTEGVNVIAISHDGQTLATGGTSAPLKLWETSSGHQLHDLNGSVDSVTSIAVSADGKVLVSGNKQNILKQWEMSSGSVVNEMGGHSAEIFAVAVSPDGKTVVSGSRDNTLKIFDALIGRELRTLEGHTNFVTGVSITQDGNTIVSGSADETIKLWKMSDGKELRTLSGHTNKVICTAVSPDGKTIASGSDDDTIRLWDAPTGNLLHTIEAHKESVFSVAFSPDGKTLLSGGMDNLVKLWDVASGSEILTFTKKESFVRSVAFSPDGKVVAAAGDGNTIKLWDAASGRELSNLLTDAYTEFVIFSRDGSFLTSVGFDKSINIWDVKTSHLVASLYSFTDGTWVVTDPEGRFDTADLEGMPHLHWVMPDDPLTPVPLEAFMKDYYEPRLLPRILNGEKFKPVRALMDLNRVQPEVKITKVTPNSKDLERALVEVEVSGAAKDYDRNGKKVPMTTGANDLRLFRDGQLVGYIDGKVVKQGDKPYRKTFNVHLPSAMSGKEITFSAYAFNDDRVKSATSRQTYQVPSTLVAKKGNAYLIHMGVNKFDNPAWNLRFAANDAHLMRKSLSDKILKTGAYQNVVPLSLISDENEHHADKAMFHAVLDRLAGKPASPLLKNLPDADHLQPATPDDLILITFAGHGYADGDGNFYLLTQDTGQGQGKEVTPDLLKRSISSEELSQWLKNVDAGDMTLIVDACQSAASVQGKDFKPGPMGSRGLGQLSFDKGMRILAASQADEYALEDNRLQQGLLSFALVTNGIEGFEADHEPKDQKIMLDEWLHYGVSRVPGLAEEVKTGKVQFVSRGGERSAIRVSATGSLKPRPAQQPALFDFAKKRRQVEVAGSVRH